MKWSACSFEWGASRVQYHLNCREPVGLSGELAYDFRKNLPLWEQSPVIPPGIAATDDQAAPPFSPPSGPAQRLFLESPARSEFLAAQQPLRSSPTWYIQWVSDQLDRRLKNPFQSQNTTRLTRRFPEAGSHCENQSRPKRQSESMALGVNGHGTMTMSGPKVPQEVMKQPFPCAC
jgi:hypothetical protein